MTEDTSRPGVAAQGEWQAELDKLLEREKSHTRVCDAIAAARRRSGRAGGAARSAPARPQGVRAG
jgi:predicted dithiol-disulfide oxidoreductase (DUF899 family)